MAVHVAQTGMHSVRCTLYILALSVEDHTYKHAYISLDVDISVGL